MDMRDNRCVCVKRKGRIAPYQSLILRKLELHIVKPKPQPG